MESRAISVEERLARIERLQERAARAGAVAKGLPDTPFREIWAAHDREVLRPEGGESRRRDQLTFAFHGPLILDLRFFFDGADMSLGDGLVSSFCPEMGEAWLQKLLSRPKVAKGKGESKLYAGATVNRCVASLQSVLTWRFGRRNNPFKAMPRQKVVKRRAWFKDEPELEDFLRWACFDLQEMLRLICNAGGMRKSEARLLKVSEVDWDARKIILPPGRRTKNGEGRVIPLRDKEYQMLVLRKEKARVIGTPYLFSSPAVRRGVVPGRPIPDRTLSGWMADAGDKWGKTLNGMRPVLHLGRHTWATWAAIKGMKFEALKKQGGWSSSEVALSYIQDAAEIHAQTVALLDQTVEEAIAASRPASARRPAKRAEPRIEANDDTEAA